MRPLGGLFGDPSEGLGGGAEWIRTLSAGLQTGRRQLLAGVCNIATSPLDNIQKGPVWIVEMPNSPPPVAPAGWPARGSTIFVTGLSGLFHVRLDFGSCSMRGL